MSAEYVLKKTVDWSLLTRGFAIPVEMQTIFSLHLSGGILRHGEKRTIEIVLNNENHKVVLTSVNFNKQKYRNHKDMWQIIYSKNGSFATSIRNLFSNSLKKFEELRQVNANRIAVMLPEGEKESVVLYATDLKDVFYAEPIFANEIQTPKDEHNEQILENLLDLPSLTNYEASIIEKYHLTKIRKLNRSIGDYLKRLYDFRCQICGQNISELYDTNVVECHHINYFVNSLNNDVDNLLIVCPNHHRIIHSTNPTFDRDKRIYVYPNGHEEHLNLNFHL